MTVNETDYLELWRNTVNCHQSGNHSVSESDIWKRRAQSFDEAVRKRWETSDSSRRWIREVLQNNSNASFLDIGAGTGAWTCFAAPCCRHVTALEPSPAMRTILKQNVQKHALTNVKIVAGTWPAKLDRLYDISLSAHSIYGCPDFAACINAMMNSTRKLCVLLLRAPLPGSLMAELCRIVHGHPYDSPNFQIAYNALLQMGILANVIAEHGYHGNPWSFDSVEHALDTIKKKLGIADSGCHDSRLKAILGKQLRRTGDCFIWPETTSSVLLYWLASPGGNCDME